MGAMGPKRGDLEPKLIIDVADASGAADLTQVVSWKMVARLRDTGALVFVDNAPVFALNDPGDKSSGNLTHTWVAGQTDTAGVLEIECKAMWPGNRPQTFPNAGYSTVTIESDLPQV